MVQRQASNKLGIQDDSKNYVKSEKRATGLKPSLSQHQDSRNRGGTELKKKIKKSRSMKLTDLENLGSPTMRRAKPQLNRPPTALSGAAATPQKSSPIKILEASPNYMKPTSSSDARKERLQVSPRSFQTSSEGKNPIQRNLHSKPTSASSSHKPSRTLTKTSSLKPVRTLTKTSSLKTARPTVKKCSELALCSDLNLGRATCSSTLKDSKFPAYVMLHPGGTESEGTSVMKVCPYTYCSLNGHHHAPLPPLKCFLSAKRRLLKTQKSMRLNCQSPLRANPSSRKKEIDTDQIAPNEELAIREAVSDSTAMSPLIEEVGTDFFIEIYAKPREEGAESIGKSIHDGDDDGIIDSAGYSETLNDIMSSVRDGDETKLENDDTEVADSLPDESSYSEISFEDNLNQNSDISVTEMDITNTFPEDTDYLPSLVQTERGLVCCIWNEWEGRNPAEIELDESVSEATEMDWEEGEFAAPDFDNEADNSTLTDDESGLTDVCFPEFEDPRLLDELVFKPDNTISNSYEKVTADGEAEQEVYDDKGASYNAQFGDKDSESEEEYKNLKTDVSSDITGEGSDSLSQDLLSSTKDAYENPEAITEEKDGDAKPDDNAIINVVSPASAEYPLEELTAATENKNEASEAEIEFLQMYPLLGDSGTNCTTDVVYETPMDEQENSSLQNDSEIDQGVSPEDPDVDAEVGPQLDELANEGCMLKGQTYASVGSETDQDVATTALGLEQSLSSADVGDAMEEKEDDANPLLEIQISESCQAFSETDQDTTMEDYDGSHQMIEVCQSDNIIEDNKLGQEVVNESLPQDHSSGKQTKRGNIDENQDLSEKDQNEGGKLNISTPIDFEEHSDTDRDKATAKDSIGEADKMQVKNSINLNAEETCLAASDITIAEKEKIVVHVASNSHQEPPKTCNSLNGTIRCRRTIKDWVEEEPREFNPREPHYLPLEPDAEAEKVDLRHQMMDDRKNSEEWMLDYALRQAVTKLAPARKRRVALLVEAFETVTPIPKYEAHLRHNTAAFGHARPIQASELVHSHCQCAGNDRVKQLKCIRTEYWRQSSLMGVMVEWRLNCTYRTVVSSKLRREWYLSSVAVEGTFTSNY
ncbi:hypothetical protein HHK36_017227 [Tetracentron sinense]|uniref:Calmodulin-binding domain-containing protein n=1 Tax=Tetracentron sinense TaxID=13715 RepID=A0A834Z108_TETSI|nr:hypothetical protein HHK36_017227 [Tetracentron sinense]